MYFIMEELKNVVVENKEVKVNKVNATKAKAKAKANSTISFDSIFKKLESNTNGLLKTSLGKKTEIYIESLFNGLNEKQKKSTRKKIRNNTYSLLESICKMYETKEKEKLTKLVKAFKEFYKEVYKVNDFSFSSIASENTKDTKKEVLTKGLQIVKNFK